MSTVGPLHQGEPLDHGTPAPLRSRIPLLDLLRGAALIGIFLVNFNKAYFAPPVDTLDRAAQLAIDFFCSGSFYPLFAFLFGLGFVLQVQRLESHGARVTSTYLRRLATLMGFGLAHSIFLWPGDVLQYYALLGVPLLLVRRLPFWILLVGVGLSLLLMLQFGVVTSLVRRSPTLASWTTLDKRGAHISDLLGPAERQAIEGDSYAQLIKVRAQITWDQWRRLPVEPVNPQIFAIFLLGLLAGRQGILARPKAHLMLLRRLMWAGLAVGLLGNFVSVFGPYFDARGIGLVPRRVMDFKGVFQVAGDSALSLFYGSALTLLVTQRDRWRRYLRPLEAVGRMALTNYLLQPAIMLVLMCGFGLGLAFKIGLAASIPLRLALFAGQIALSVWWLQRFRFGPLEWLWRAATYWSLPPLLVRSAGR
jgi:uncharacterized protein